LREASRQVKRGFLLHGASGTGKTLTAIHREMSRAGNSVLDRPRETTART
jgi:SpoVK/Ycf46/Vps4 family AAA+-type ATPase